MPRPSFGALAPQRADRLLPKNPVGAVLSSAAGHDLSRLAHRTVGVTETATLIEIMHRTLVRVRRHPQNDGPFLHYIRDGKALLAAYREPGRWPNSVPQFVDHLMRNPATEFSLCLFASVNIPRH